MISFYSKTQEISYAVLRVASNVRRYELRCRLERMAYDMAEAGAREAHEDLLLTSTALRALLALGSALYAIESIHASGLERELKNLDSAIRKSFGFMPLPNLNEIFTAANIITKSSDVPVDDSDYGTKDDFDSNLLLDEDHIDVHHNVAPDNIATAHGMTSFSVVLQQAQDRQDAMLKFIERFGSVVQSSSSQAVNGFGNHSATSGTGCRMKDLVAEFPNVSERTLRNDLQRLLNQGAIAREGVTSTACYFIPSHLTPPPTQSIDVPIVLS